ncbi:MAG: thiol:disulfide interchange protein DsbA/DsbL [Pseudomonadota bacterium]
MRMIEKLLFALTICGLAAIGNASASVAAPKSGVEYETVSEAQRTDTGNKVEVIEFFSYACPHCNHFDPLLAGWVKQNADKVAFKRVHVAFRENEVPLQRMYLTMDAMGITEKYHAKVFGAIHDNQQPLFTDEQVFNWIEQAGIDRTKFISMYRGFSAQSWVNRAQATINTYNINSWPMVAIGGHYLTSPYYANRAAPTAGSETVQQQNALQVMDFLVQKAKSEKK